MAEAKKQRLTDIGPPHYKVPASDHQRKLREVEIPRSGKTGCAPPYLRNRGKTVVDQGCHAAAAQHCLDQKNL